MSCIGIFLLFFVIITINEAQGQCNEERCDVICNQLDFGVGFCDVNECVCSNSKKCSELIDETCDMTCHKIRLPGKCDDNDLCTCTAKVVSCWPLECQHQCLTDPRAADCEAQGGFVTALACLKYGWIKTCGCLCTLPGTDSVHVKKFNYILPIKSNKSPKLFHNYHLTSNV